MSRVLLTGAGGFIGRSLAESLRGAGFGVVGAGRQRPPSWDPAAWRQLDLSISADAWADGICAGVDVVIHLAGIAHDNAADPDAYRRVNCLAAVNLARRAARAQVRRFVFVSSAQAIDPGQSAYARAKADAESELQSVAADLHLEMVLLRPALVYGPGVGGNLALLMRAIQRGWLPPLPPDCGRRPMIALEDLVLALRLAVAADWPLNVPLLLSDGQRYSLQRIARALYAGRGRRYPGWYLPRRVWLMAAGAADLLRRLPPLKRLPASATLRRQFVDLEASIPPALCSWTPTLQLEDSVAQMWQAGAAP